MDNLMAHARLLPGTVRRAETFLSRAVNARVSFGNAAQAEVHKVVEHVGPELLLKSGTDPVQVEACIRILWEIHVAVLPQEGEWESWHTDDIALRDMGNAYGLVNGCSSPIGGERDGHVPPAFGPLYIVKHILLAMSRVMRVLPMSRYS